MSAFARLAREFSDRIWPTALGFGLVSIVLTAFNSPGLYVGDNRLEQYLNPARRLAKSFSVWDGASGIGGVREDFWPGTTVPVAILRGLGLGIFGAERAWHALCLTLAAVGAVQVLRLFRRQIGVEHLVCGAIVAFGPFSAVFLVPSNLYFQYALGPWLLVAFVNGVRGVRPWKWAACFALATFMAGNVDPPGLIANLFVLVPAGIYVVVVERTTTLRRVAGWTARAFVLSLGCGFAGLVKTYFALDSLTLRLDQSEAAAIGAATSSWPETMRGLGNWLSYVVVNGDYVKPQNLALFRNPLLVALSFAPLLIAAAMLTWSRWRPRVLFGAMALQSMVWMVGGFPASRSSSFGRVLLWSMENVRPIKGFRNTYKAGLGLTLGLGALSGMAVIEARERWSARRPRPSRGPLFVAGLLVTGLAFPFWSGNLYNPTEGFRAVPSYWSDAFGFLDSFEFGGRSMIVPATSRSRYRWGWVGDDIFDALLTRSHPVSTGVPLSNPLAANLLETMTLRMQDPVYRPGVIGPMARRLGITEIVIRNDLDWASLGVARPVLYEGLRRDVDLERVATFGNLGQNVTAPGDNSATAGEERLLTPVEIYRVKDPSPLVRVDGARPAVVVSGDGGALPEMAANGLLGGDASVIYSGSATDGSVLAQLRDKGGVVVSDTNRRRLRSLVSYEPDYSSTLAADQEGFREVRRLFPDVAGAESVAWFPDATAIKGVTNRLGGETTEYRPAMAFDGDPDTRWQLSQYEIALGRTLRVDLGRFRYLSAIRIQSILGDLGVPTVTEATVRFADGRFEQVRATADGRLDATFEPHLTDFVEIQIVGYDAYSSYVGLVDVEIPGLDLREFVQVPDDLLRRADRNPALSAALATEPMTYLFERVQRPSYRVRLGYGERGEHRADEEATIRRRFWTVGARTFRVEGVARLRPAVDDELVNTLVRADITATSTLRWKDRPGTWALGAVDGDRTTAWQAPVRQGGALTLRFAPQTVSKVRVVSSAPLGFVPIGAVEVTIGSMTRSARLAQPPGCTLQNSSERCLPIADVTFPDATFTDRLIVRVSDIQPSLDLNATSMRIDEVELNGTANTPLDAGAPLNRGCGDIGVRVGGKADDVFPIPVRITGTVRRLLAGDEVQIASCDDVRLPTGWHVLDVVAPFLDRMSFTSTDIQPRVSPPRFGLPVSTSETSAGQITAKAQTDGTSTVVLAYSYDPAWQLSVNGSAFTAAEAVNGVNGWTLAETGQLALSFRYRPDRTLALAVVASMLAVLLCSWLALRRPRTTAATLARLAMRTAPPTNRSVVPEDTQDGSKPGDSGPQRGLALVCALLTVPAILLIGPIGIALVVGAWWSGRRSERPGRVIGAAALTLLSIMVLVSTFQSRPQFTTLSLNYALRRTAANEFGAVGAVCLIIVVGVTAWHERLARAPLGDRDAAFALGRATRRLYADALRQSLVPASAATAVACTVGRLVGRVQLSPGYADLVANLRRGSAYTTAVGSGAPALDAAPVGPTLEAFLPAIGGGLIAVATFVCALVVFHVASSRGGRRAGLVALGAFVVLPSTWGASLAVMVAGTAVLAAVSVGDSVALGRARAFGAGCLLAVAVLARPDAVVVILPLAWWWWRARVDRLTMLCGASGLVLIVAPWANFVWSQGVRLRLTGTWDGMLADPLERQSGGAIVQWAIWAAMLLLVSRLLRRLTRPLTVDAELLTVVALSVVLGVVSVMAAVPRDPVAWAGPAAATVIGLLVARRRQPAESVEHATNDAYNSSA